MTYFDEFGKKWADQGSIEPISDTQRSVGWDFLGSVPPISGQFNQVQQNTDEKINYLFNLINAFLLSRGVSLGPTTTNALRDTLNSILSAIASGAKAYGTLDELLAVENPAKDTFSWVLNDPVKGNNGMWRFDGTDWVKGVDLYTQLIDELGRSLRIGLAEIINEAQLYQTTDGQFPYAVLDEDGKTAIAVDANGRQVMFDTIVDPGDLAQRQYPLAYIDTEDRIGLAITYAGNVGVNNLEILTDDTSEGGLGVTDENDKMAVDVTSEGELGVAALNFFPMGGEPFRVNDDGDQNALILDEDGHALFELSGTRLEHFRRLSGAPILSRRGASLPEGGVVFLQDNVSANVDRYLSDVSGETRPYLNRIDIPSGTYIYDGKEIIYQLSTGQSLSMGGGAQGMPAGQEVFNAIAPNPQFCLMFDTGVRGVDANDRTAPETAVDFVSIKEVYGISQGETQGSGFTSWAHRNAVLNKNPLAARVFRAGGRGATSIDLLDKAGGGVVYPHNISDLERAISIANVYGKQIKSRSVIWTHGEADRNKPVEEYKSKVIQLATDYRADFAALLPVDNPPIVFIMDQLCANNAASSAGNVSIAQLQASNEVDFIYLSTPKYIFRFVDDAHLLAPEYAVLGEYNAKVEHYICDLGENWKPLQPINIQRTGNKIVIDFHVPRGGIVIDTVTLPQAENLGFEYGDDANSAQIIDVEQVASRRIVVTLNKTPTGANKTLRYAYTRQSGAQSGRSGSWGNIRDEDYSPSFQAPGRRLTNWCVVFNQTIN